MPEVITRFAPSPTGLLHLGHAYSAHMAFGYAAERNGVCYLRIEDIDTVRCKPEYEHSIINDLEWLGFSWPKPIRRQSDCFQDYVNALGRLINLGLVYRCFRSRKQIDRDVLRAPHQNAAPVYLGPSEPLTALDEKALLDSGKPFAWRLSLRACEAYLGESYRSLSFVDNGIDVAASPWLLGDVILGRKDVGTSYHLSCCHDDALQGVTDIVRGVDLFESTHIHTLLQAIMNWPHPVYHHHKLLVDADGKRFAKRDKSKTLRQMRLEGITSDIILAQIAVGG